MYKEVRMKDELEVVLVHNASRSAPAATRRFHELPVIWSRALPASSSLSSQTPPLTTLWSPACICDGGIRSRSGVYSSSVGPVDGIDAITHISRRRPTQTTAGDWDSTHVVYALYGGRASDSGRRGKDPTSQAVFLGGGELGRVLISSNDTHDAVLYGDRVYAANTVGAKLMEFKYPSMELSKLQKLNKMDDGSFKRVSYIRGFGKECHAIVWHNDSFLVLDSLGGRLMRVKPDGCWEADPFGNRFFKGMNVVDDIAYFGISFKAKRVDRLYPTAHGELAAFHLVENRLLWRREVHTSGLLNVVAAPQLGKGSTQKTQVASNPHATSGTLNIVAGPQLGKGSTQQTQVASNPRAHKWTSDGVAARQLVKGSTQKTQVASNPPAPQLGADSTYKAQVTSNPLDIAKMLQQSTLRPVSDNIVLAAAKVFADLGFSPKSTGKWPSGAPKMDLSLKASNNEIWDAGVYLPMGEVDVGPLQDKLVTILQELLGVNIAAAANVSK
eukprot:gene1847-33266_t